MQPINNTFNDSFMPWNEFEYSEGVPSMPSMPSVYGNGNGNIYNDQTSVNFNNTHSHIQNDNYSMHSRVTNTDHLLPPMTPSQYSNVNYSNSNTKFNGINDSYTQRSARFAPKLAENNHLSQNSITMPSIIGYDNDTNSCSNSSTHFSPKQSPQSSQSPNQVSATAPNMQNMLRMSAMMKEMKQNMSEMLMITNMNYMKNMNAMFTQNQPSFAPQTPVKSDISMPFIDDGLSAHMPPPIPSVPVIPARVTKKRTLVEVASPMQTEMTHENDTNSYPQIGVRVTTTVQLSKQLFAGHSALHFEIAREILLRAIRRITEYRWVHSKYNLDTAKDIKYLLFLNEDNVTALPKAFQSNKPKRGRPPKNKKLKLDLVNTNKKQWNLNAANDKMYRLNFQIVFAQNVSQQIRTQIIKCIEIDLNKKSFTQLLSNVISANVSVTDSIRSYSLYAVECEILKEYRKYEKEEDARKKKKREREQKRRENKKKETQMM